MRLFRRRNLRERILNLNWKAHDLAPALPRTYWYGLKHIAMSNKIGNMGWTIISLGGAHLRPSKAKRKTTHSTNATAGRASAQNSNASWRRGGSPTAEEGLPIPVHKSDTGSQVLTCAFREGGGVGKSLQSLHDVAWPSG